MIRLTLILFYIFLLASCTKNNDTEVTDNSPLFQRVPSSHSHVTFSNDLKEDVSTRQNLLDFDYFYNGGGVAICDLNNDDLPDLFFAGNQVDNRIYLNRGNLVFEDITADAGINIGKTWSNGVTFTDVNNDGWIDLYVSQGGPEDRHLRKNLLYVNQQDLTFKEMAFEYGLDDEGISTQSAFFDFDNDGDQDCFVMNENELSGFDPVTFHRALLENPGRFENSFSHLYENRNGKFVDISKKAGISAPTFGLGLAIGDVNDDGWLDIYVANDYYLPDNLYINLKNGTFSDRIKNHVDQISFFGMGVDIADLNNDTYQDILVLDMASQDHVRSKTLMASMNVDNFSLLVDQFGFTHQYMFNTVQINDGSGHFGNVAQMTGMAKTDWSWAALANDYDLDGDKDVLVTNGYRRYALDNDFKSKVSAIKKQYNNQVPLQVKAELYAQMPSEALPNLLYRNDGDLQFVEVSGSSGLSQPTFSNGAASADLDKDGDLDLVISNIDQESIIYENVATTKSHNSYLRVEVVGDQSAYAKITAITNGTKQFIQMQSVRGYRSAMEPIALFGLGNATQVDTLRVELVDGRTIIKTKIKKNQTIQIRAAEAQPQERELPKITRALIPYAATGFGLDYTHQENQFNDFEHEILLPQKQSTMGPFTSAADVNKDGLIDLWIGGASGQAASLYLQSEGGRFEKSDQPAFENDQAYEDMESLFFDLDQDGDLDLYVSSGDNCFPEGDKRYEDRLYLNNGEGIFSTKDEAALRDHRYSGKCVRAIDFDSDGDVDILVGNRIIPQSYPMAASSYFFENREGVLQDVTSEIVPGLSDVGIINDIVVKDLDGDGDPDFIAVGEWTGIQIFMNEQGVFKQPPAVKALKELTGWWFSIHETDVNRDGLPDFIVGNVGENFKHKASKERPFKVFANDFDDSGNLSIVLSSQYKGQYVPVRGRECSSQQMPMIAEKFQNYQSFANATLLEVYGDEKLTDAYSRAAVTFSSILLLNTGQSDLFQIIDLPKRAQEFPLLDLVSKDLNSDGFPDLITVGCIYETEVETPRLDNGHGLVLLSNGVDGYILGDPEIYRMLIPGNVKSLAKVNIAGPEYLIATKNNDMLSIFMINQLKQM